MKHFCEYEKDGFCVGTVQNCGCWYDQHNPASCVVQFHEIDKVCPACGSELRVTGYNLVYCPKCGYTDESETTLNK